MRVTIQSVELDYVYFDTGFGIVKGVWRSTGNPEQREYQVELKPNAVYSYDDFRVSETREYHTEIIDGKNVMTLLLLHCVTSSVLHFQFGNSVIRVTVKNDNHFWHLQNEYVTVAIESFDIYCNVPTPKAIPKNRTPVYYSQVTDITSWDNGSVYGELVRHQAVATSKSNIKSHIIVLMQNVILLIFSFGFMCIEVCFFDMDVIMVGGSFTLFLSWLWKRIIDVSLDLSIEIRKLRALKKKR